MKKAISPYLPMTWASDILVHDWPGEPMFVEGKLPFAAAELQSSRDPFLRYLSSVQLEFAQKGVLASPHISFPNATSDQALMEFVEEFGPVVATDVFEDKVDQTQANGTSLEEKDWRGFVGARQDLATLRIERRTYAAALELLTELRLGENAVDISAIQRHISDIADGVSSWPEQREAERQWRTSHNFAPMAWHFDSNQRHFIWLLKADVFLQEPPPLDGAFGTGPDYVGWALRMKPYRAGHLVLCALINAFDTEVKYFKDRPVETSPFGSLRFGVRPALYLILKHLYLGGSGVPVCGNDRCRRFFENERAGQRFCTPECSQRYRQRKYWAKAGSDLRKRRAAKKN